MKHGIFLSLVLALLVGCAEERTVPTITVSPETFQVQIRAEGELAAAQSTPITVPPLPGPQILSWLVDGNTEVAAGAVIARFDDTEFRLQASDANTEIEKLALQGMDKQRELAAALVQMGDSRDEVELEKDMVDRFNVDNPLLYSRLEIIDAMRDEGFLDAQLGFYDEKSERYEGKSAAEMEVIRTQREAQQAKLTRSESSMAQLEVTAPHAGLLIHEKNWWGEPPRVGQSLFPGMKLASLPDLSKMQAKVYVPEKEAVGLQEGLDVRVVVDAFPNRPLQGLVESVSKTAQSRERNSPVKYFTVTIALDEADPTWLLPGRRVTVTIMAADVADALVLPNQAIEQGEGGNTVWVQRGDRFEQVDVTLGVRGMARSQVVSGLEPGERVALVKPGGSA